MSPFRASVPLTDTWEHFQFSVSDGIGTVTLDRPGKLNALTFEAYADLRDLLAELPHRGDTRVLVIRGNGRAPSISRHCDRRLRRRPASRRRSECWPNCWGMRS